MPKMGKEEDKDSKDTTSPFTLKNASTGFEGRSTDIFGQLDLLEKKHISHEQTRTDLDVFADLNRNKDEEDEDKDGVDRTSAAWKKKMLEGPRKGDDGKHGEGDKLGVPQEDAEKPDTDMTRASSHRQDRNPDERWSGSDDRQPSKQDASSFRKPYGRAPQGSGRGHYRGRGGRRQGRVPDHGTRPDNWTHYSLEDVAGADMSDKANTQAALAFLEERRRLREREEEGMEEEEAFDVNSAACSKGLFSFAKRSKNKPSSSSSETLEKNASPRIEGEKPLASAVGHSEISPEASASEDKEEVDELEQTLDDEDRVESSEASVSSSAASKDEDDVAKAPPSFKSRKKGIRRNIRRCNDDD